jgi:hypothetical protein
MLFHNVIAQKINTGRACPHGDRSMMVAPPRNSIPGGCGIAGATPSMTGAAVRGWGFGQYQLQRPASELGRVLGGYGCHS